jgi:deoxyribodipyrimidine photo-lyase
LIKPIINIVWFKRDLRLADHKPLQLAVEAGLPILLLYCFEPSLMQYGDSDPRHWRFVYQSLQQIQQQLAPNKATIEIVHANALVAFETIAVHYQIQHIFSHEETGNKPSFDRDKAIKIFCRLKQITWIETPTNGIIRGLQTRKDFSKHWHEVMFARVFDIDLAAIKTISIKGLLPGIENDQKLFQSIFDYNPVFQPGGEINANAYLQSFLYERKSNYNRHISKPLESRRSCSRLSTYLTWGNISMKQVYQASLQAIAATGDKRNINFFINRLHWHCHFIQKFESECRMEFENLNKGFNHIRTEENSAFVAAWKTGITGYPLVDACMKCVTATGYLNFRMRSMLVSFLTHHLWQPWQSGAHHLAQQFLDYEPGIHYPQFQMQAGTMGVNTIRMYNPIKQSKDHDPLGIFIKKWLPVLQNVPEQFIHEPWTMTEIEQQLYQCTIGEHYPAPIVDLQASGVHARDILWSVKKSKTVQDNNKGILKKHTKRKTAKELPLKAPTLF